MSQHVVLHAVTSPLVEDDLWPLARRAIFSCNRVAAGTSFVGIEFAFSRAPNRGLLLIFIDFY